MMKSMIKRMLAVAAASTLCLLLGIAAHAEGDAPKSDRLREIERIFSETRANALDYGADLSDVRSAAIRLSRYTTPNGTELELFGVIDWDRNVHAFVAAVKKDGSESIVPLDIIFDSRYEPELAAASPTGGAPDDVLLRVFEGGGTGIYIEGLYLLRPYIGGVEAIPFDGDQLAQLASELVDIRAEGTKASFVRSEKAGDAGTLIFSVDADEPIKLPGLDHATEPFTLQVRYRFDAGTGRAVACISPVLTVSSEDGPHPMWCDETIEFDVQLTAASDGARSFSISDPRLADTQN